MSLVVAINLNSLSMIKEEIDNCIAQAATEFEAYLANQSELTHIEHSIAAILQVAGTFRLLQYPGAALLSQEIADTAKAIVSQELKATDSVLASITHNLFVLPRYLEFLTLRKSALPILLIPYINELRIARKQSLLPEYHLYSGVMPNITVDVSSATPLVDEALTAVPRLRHMFQVGLLGVIAERNSSPYFGELMLRAVSRISGLLIGHASGEIWHLATGFITCLSTQSLEITLNRKRNLSAIEKMFRQFASKGEQGLLVESAAELKKDLLFLIALSDCDEPLVLGIKKDYGLPKLDITDTGLRKEREKMYGPSVDTMESVIKVIKEEIRHSKDILELASQNESILNEDVVSLLDIVSRVADTLTMLNLTGPMQLLRAQYELIQAWEGNATRTDFLSIADDLLFVEGALSCLERHEVSVDELNDADEEIRKSIIAKSQLAEAERVVLEEAQSGIALSKRAISSYVESNFDTGHIANIAVTLNTVRGGLRVLNYNRAAAILKSSGDFIESHINSKNENDQRHQLLETLADALISMEYYLGEVASGNKVNEKILDVAEESLSALGFAVET